MLSHGEGRHRVGPIVPSASTTMETEIPALLREREFPRDRFGFHSARDLKTHWKRLDLRG